MIEDLVIKYCSPTLAGLKTGNLFGFRFFDRRTLIDDLRSLNMKLSVKGVRALPLSVDNNRAIIYIYRPSRLEEDLSNYEARRTLFEMGYDGGNVHEFIAELSRRVRVSLSDAGKSIATRIQQDSVSNDTENARKYTGRSGIHPGI